MSTAQQLKSFHGSNISEMLEEASRLGDETQDWDNEATEYDFPDGSVLIVCNDNASAYGSR